MIAIIIFSMSLRSSSLLLNMVSAFGSPLRYRFFTQLSTIAFISSGFLYLSSTRKLVAFSIISPSLRPAAFGARKRSPFMRRC